MNPLLEAPPTPEEIQAAKADLATPPTEEEIRAVRGGAAPEESGLIDSLAAAGKSMFNIANFGDEMAGGVASLLDSLGVGGGVTNKDAQVAKALELTPEEARLRGLLTTRDALYDQTKQEQQANYGQSRAEHPVASVMGDIGQGIMTSIIAAPAISKVAGAAGGLMGAEAAPAYGPNLAKTFFGNSLGQQGVKALTNRALTSTLTENVLAGGGYGAAAGAGASDKKDIGGVLSDAAQGAYDGGITGGLLYGTALTGAAKGIGGAAKGTMNFIKDTPFWRLMHKAYKGAATTGKKMYGIERNAELETDFRDYATEVYQRWIKAKHDAGAAKDAVLAAHADEVVNDVLPTMQKAFDILSDEGVDEAARNQAKELFESLIYVVEAPEISKTNRVIHVTDGKAGVVKDISHIKGGKIGENNIQDLIAAAKNGENIGLRGNLNDEQVNDLISRLSAEGMDTTQATVTRFPKRKTKNGVIPETTVLSIRQAQEAAKTLRDPNVTVSELDTAIDKIQRLIRRVENKDADLANQLREQVEAPLRAKLNTQVPALEAPNSRLKASYDLEDFFPKPDYYGSNAAKSVGLTDEEKFAKWMESLSDPQKTRIKDKLYNFIAKSNTSPNPGVKDELSAVSGIISRLTGEDGGKDIAKMQELADNLKMAQAFGEAKPLAETIKGQTLGVTKGLGVAISSAAGGRSYATKKAIGGAINAIKTEGAPIGRAVAGAYRSIVDHTPDELRALGRSFLGFSGARAKELGRILTEASQRDTVGRRALIFALEQNPEYRKMLHGDPNEQQ